MADSKFSKLPYIASDQPDIYETDDLPESDQALQTEEAVDESVEQISIDTKASFLKFNSGGKSQVFGEFSSVDEAGKCGYETVDQALDRIIKELDLLQSLGRTKFGDNPGSLLGEIEKLQSKVASTRTSRVGNESVDLNYDQLLTQLKSAGQTTSSEKSPKQAGASSAPNTVQYELNLERGTDQASQLSSLEQRLRSLEAAVGTSLVESPLTVGMGTTLSEIMSNITTNLKLLDSDNVDKLTARFQLLIQSSEKVAEGAVKTVKQSQAVDETYNLIKQWEATHEALPQIVDRLYTLQDLHQQAMDFSSSLRALEQAQAELQGKLTSHSSLLSEVGQQFQANTDIVMDNIAALDQRISKLN